VQEIAFDRGYSTASAFIAMFQREAGTTPEQYRRECCGIA
jgi:AraC-like DNA-binding protein